MSITEQMDYDISVGDTVTIWLNGGQEFVGRIVEVTPLSPWVRLVSTRGGVNTNPSAITIDCAQVCAYRID